ncbi:MAG: hypothetical protein LBV39_00670 [Bacteroidales bacterium]|jgi:hypothetical protein|nr:hypothetical protein [Bacteroidales bacterium]
MNNLEEYIRKNKSMFDEEPETGHFERLQEKLYHRNRQHKTRTMLRWSVAAAASIALVFATGIYRQHDSPISPEYAHCETSDDMKMCYLDKMNTVADEIRLLTGNLEPWDREIVMEDVENIIEATHNSLANELPEELSPEALHSILADYYRTNLQSMQNIVETLKEV